MYGFGIDTHTTATQLCELAAKKVGLVDHSQFAIYEVKNDEERCLSADDWPCSIVEKWSPASLSKNGSETSAASESRLVFKKKIFVRDEDEQDKSCDLAERQMLYIQALHNVIDGEYPCTVEEAEKLAALHTQVTCGDHNPTTHIPGYFGPQNLSNFIPKPLMSLKPTKEWESRIFKLHQNYKGVGGEDAKNMYLSIVKGWSYYGTQYFKNCRNISKSKALPPKVMIGVNVDGIVLASSKEKKDQVGCFLFTDLISWSSQNGPCGTFSFECGSPNDSTKYSFETKYAWAISDLIQSYVDVLVQAIKLDIETSSPKE